MSKQVFNTAPVGWDSSQQKVSTMMAKSWSICRPGFISANITRAFKAGVNPSLHLFAGACTLLSMSAQAQIPVSQSQTCKTSITANTPNSRFEVLASGSEVKDTQTGLIWQRCSLGQTWDATANNGNGSCAGTASTHNWQDALTQAQSLGNGYRLPNIKELASIVALNCYGPAINLDIFPNTPSARFWSSSPVTRASYAGDAWNINFGYGNNNWNYKYDTGHVRAVR